MSADREQILTQAFTSIANGWVDGLDAVDQLADLTTHCAQLLDIASAGLLLADGHGVLHLLAASSERTRSLELFQLQSEEGPCLDCYHAGAPVIVDDLSLEVQRWPQFVAAATGAGFASVHAVPMRLRDTVLGTLGLFGTRTGALREEDLSLAQALAHMASIALVAGEVAPDKAALDRQLQAALTSRVGLEQAKGILAQLGDLDMDQSFTALRRYARDHSQRLSDVARRLVSGDLLAARVLEHASSGDALATTEANSGPALTHNG
jgi:transcriptional regulator with GAF, ATPase, and Fis domain